MSYFSLVAFHESRGTATGGTQYHYVNLAIKDAQLILARDEAYENVLVRWHHEGKIHHVYNVDNNGTYYSVERLPQHPKWFPLYTDNMEYVGIVEFQADDGEWHVFTFVRDVNFIVFGGVCNIGLLQSGSFQMDTCFSFDENLQELVADLESYYNGEAGYQSYAFLCNDRM